MPASPAPALRWLRGNRLVKCGDGVCLESFSGVSAYLSIQADAVYPSGSLCGLSASGPDRSMLFTEVRDAVMAFRCGQVPGGARRAGRPEVPAHHASPLQDHAADACRDYSTRFIRSST